VIQAHRELARKAPGHFQRHALAFPRFEIRNDGLGHVRALRQGQLREPAQDTKALETFTKRNDVHPLFTNNFLKMFNL
jgi:hypothetical protein